MQSSYALHRGDSFALVHSVDAMGLIAINWNGTQRRGGKELLDSTQPTKCNDCDLIDRRERRVHSNEKACFQ